MATQNNSNDIKKEKNSPQGQNKQTSSPKKNFSSSNKQQKDSDLLDMNLAEGEIVHYFNWKRASFILISSIILVVFLLWGIVKGISFWGAKRVEQNEIFSQKIQQIEDQIDKVKSEARSLFIFKKKVQLANKLVDKHIYWTNFFNYLEENTLEEVYYTEFKGDINGKYSLPTKVNDYNVINSQVKQMRKQKETENAEVRKATQKEKEVELNIDLKINQKLFTK